MRKLMHGNGSTDRRRAALEEGGPDLVVAAEVVHRHQIRRDLHQVSSIELDGGQDSLDIGQDRFGLDFDVEAGSAEVVDLGPGYRVIGPAGTRA